MRYLVSFILALCSVAVCAQNQVINRPSAKSEVKSNVQASYSPLDKILVGTHLFSLQWISWEKFGKAKITKTGKKNVYKISGRQDDARGNYLTIQGTIIAKSKTELVFKGKIITRVDYINNGQPCVRDGEYHFLQTEGRHYWRLQEMVNPCESCCDYVDIFLK